MRPLGLVIVFLIGSVAPVWGALATGGDWELINSVTSGGGANSLTSASPANRHEFAVGEAHGEELTGGIYLLISGFHSLIPASAPGNMLQAVISSGNLNTAGMTMVLADNNPVQVRFANDVDPLSIDGSAAAVAAVMDAQGNPLSNPTPVTITYDGTIPAMILTPTSGNWSKGHLYELYVTTDVVDINGDNLPSVATFTFATVRDNLVDNVVVMRSQPTLRLSVPANAFSTPYVLALSSGATTPAVESANSKMLALGSDRRPSIVVQASPYSDSGQYVENISRAAALTIPYNDADNNGVIDNSALRAKTLAAWRLQEPENLWVKQNGAAIDTVNKTVVYPTTRFSYYALIGGADTEVKDILAFPVPFRPNAGPATRYGTWAEGIKFANLPSEGTIKIYTVSGKLVRTLDIASPLQSWDARDSSGAQVASGMYLWVAESGGNRKTGKLVIIK
jgi:hypothetical protein